MGEQITRERTNCQKEVQLREGRGKSVSTFQRLKSLPIQQKLITCKDFTSDMVESDRHAPIAIKGTTFGIDIDNGALNLD